MCPKGRFSKFRSHLVLKISMYTLGVDAILKDRVFLLSLKTVFSNCSAESTFVKVKSILSGEKIVFVHRNLVITSLLDPFWFDDKVSYVLVAFQNMTKYGTMV